MFGVRDEADFVSRAPWQYSPKCQPDGRDSADKAKEMIETAVREGSHFFEWTHARIDGTPFPATVLLTRMEFGGETLFQATVRDITPQKRLEEERERAAEEFRDLYERHPADITPSTRTASSFASTTPNSLGSVTRASSSSERRSSANS